jgi:hypothetical protein
MTKLDNYLRMYRKRADLSQDEVAYLLSVRNETQASRTSDSIACRTSTRRLPARRYLGFRCGNYSQADLSVRSARSAGGPAT